MIKSDVQFLEAGSSELFNAVSEKRYTVFVEELQRSYPTQFLQNGKLIEPLDKRSANLVLLKSQHIIGGVRLTPLRVMIEDDPAFLKNYDVAPEDLEKSVYASKLFINPPSLRHQRYLPFFIANLYCFLARNGIAKLYLNTNPQLLGLYEKLGLSPVGTPFTIPEVGNKVIAMVGVLDEGYLARCKSRVYAQYIKKLCQATPPAANPPEAAS